MFQRVLLDFVLKTFGLGAENETRTRDPNLGKVVLYQLSYFRVCMRCFCRFARLAKVGVFILLGQGCALPTELFPHYFIIAPRELIPFCDCKYRHFFVSCKKNRRFFTSAELELNIDRYSNCFDPSSNIDGKAINDFVMKSLCPECHQ